MPIPHDIVTPGRLVYSDEVDEVVVPGSQGELGILPHHAPLLTTLGLGELRIRKGGSEESFAIIGGFLQVRPDRAVVMAETADMAAEIDLERAEEARREAERALEGGFVGPAAATLTGERCRFDNVPDIEDVRVMADTLRDLGVVVDHVAPNRYEIASGDVEWLFIPLEAAAKMGATFVGPGPAPRHRLLPRPPPRPPRGGRGGLPAGHGDGHRERAPRGGPGRRAHDHPAGGPRARGGRSHRLPGAYGGPHRAQRPRSHRGRGRPPPAWR